MENSNESQHSEASPQHTPGPWEYYYPDQDSVEHLIRSQDGTYVCHDEGLRFADANLIAAAPDLLAALEEAAAWLGALGGTKATDALAARCRMAVAKARGRRP